jgi:predicted lipoprotein
MRLVAANLAGLHDLYTSGGLRDDMVKADVTHPSINVAANARLIETELVKARTTVEALAGNRAPFTDPAASDKLVGIGFPLKNVRIQTAALLSLTAGVTLGFNSSDGD